LRGFINSKTALGRVGQPADIAKVVAFLASDAGGWITGEVIGANGGLRI
jgi:NAD(P)-dependent dehydrogenase (short-subunit alcohol dehydrogenase family)